MENDSYYRHFLICNKLANEMNTHQPQNFAKLLLEEENGKIGNAQMTWYFKKADFIISRITDHPENYIWDVLDMEELAELSIEQIESDYEEFCNEKLSIIQNI